ncbi:hypothetical protein BCV69DRAFT_159792 [Microstroma glucosiphilum]|uniref:t-SNARE coiled-coil homology domain-containing protein n=1 Tax=Pseudomicrostroma glucosiphilum TaxID=1684307 RepID=A0A316U9R7_9BASI|nr:hypothetical protein BCV69DRAFT_159792 [Pseudomicrostroma glucosiphilum]PWN21912.1 hypothetical protein BCV69DRAFT_159792 [Pseudomicrostroma glucosiphilum]
MFSASQAIDSRTASPRLSETVAVQSYLSSASMARYLERSIKQSSRKAGSHSSISLPPVPRLVVGSNSQPEGETLDQAAREKARLRQEAEEAEMAEYETASNLRRRGGYKAANDESEDGERAGGTKDEKAASTSYPPSTSTAPVVSGDRSTQEALSSELLRMASILKNQTISFSSALERDRKLLESTDQQLSQNLDLMTRTRGRLGEYAHKARGMGWLTLGTVVMVVITWMLMFVVIKLT